MINFLNHGKIWSRAIIDQPNYSQTWSSWWLDWMGFRTKTWLLKSLKFQYWIQIIKYKKLKINEFILNEAKLLEVFRLHAHFTRTKKCPNWAQLPKKKFLDLALVSDSYSTPSSLKLSPLPPGTRAMPSWYTPFYTLFFIRTWKLFWYHDLMSRLLVYVSTMALSFWYCSHKNYTR